MELPVRACDTQHLTPDTHVTRLLMGEGVNPVAVFVNSMVITGAEPIVVDCGPAIVRDLWLEKTFSVVDPADVRWIFLSHDDADHVGNLPQVLELCPQATVVTTWFMVERMGADYVLPLDRLRWVNDGERFRAGDRELVALTPPTFDSPTTRGLLDTRTGVYWASDSFGLPVTHEVDDVTQLDPGFSREAFLTMNRVLSPWHAWLDPTKYRAHLARLQSFDATALASAHGPAFFGPDIADGYRMLAELPRLPAAPLPGQPELEAMVAALAAA